MCLSIRSDTDGVAIQQPVWRPTGTQLGKKKSSRDPNKNEKNASITKKRNPLRKIRAKDVYVGDGAPTESVKSSNEQQAFVYQQQSASQAQINEIQAPPQSLHPQTDFGNTLSLTQETQPIYQHPGLNISQNWPLDLVQGSHHYPQVCITCLSLYKHSFDISFLFPNIRVNKIQYLTNK